MNYLSLYILAAVIFPLHLLAESAPVSLPDRLRELDATQTDRLIYSQIGRANLLSDKKQVGKLVIMDYAVREYERKRDAGEAINWKNFTSTLNAAISKYNHEAKLMDDPTAISTRELDYLGLGISAIASCVKTLPQGRVANVATGGLVDGALDATDSLGQIGVELLRDYQIATRGPAEQRKAQLQITGLSARADSILNKVHSIGREVPEFATSVDTTVGLDARADIKASARENLERNQQTKDSLRLEAVEQSTNEILVLNQRVLEHVEANINAEGKLTIDYAPIAAIAGNLQGELLKAVDQSTEKIIGVISKIEDNRVTELTDQKIRQLKYQAAQSSVFLLSGLASAVDPRGAEVIGVVGSATIQVVSTVENFQATMKMAAFDGQTLVGALNLVTGIGSAVQLIFSLFAGPSPEQLILEQIAKLGERIQKLEAGMHDRFNAVDAKLVAIMYSMHQGFEEVSRGLSQVQINQRTMQNALTNLEDGLTRLNIQVFYYLRDGFQERIHEDQDYCANQGGLSPNDFERCLERYATYATRHASNSLAAGVGDAIVKQAESRTNGVDMAYAALQVELGKGLWNNIDVLGKFLSWRFQDASLVGRGTALPNLEEWSQYTQEFTRFIASQPDYLRLYSGKISDTAEKIQQVGEGLNGSLSHLATTRYEGDEPKSTILNLVSDYEDAFSKLQTAMETNRRTFRALKADGYDPFVSDLAEQPRHNRIAFEHTDRKVLRPCGDAAPIPFHKGGFPELTAPDNMGAMIPAAWHEAEAMKLGRVNICYSRVFWSGDEPYLHYDLRMAGHEEGMVRNQAKAYAKENKWAPGILIPVQNEMNFIEAVRKATRNFDGKAYLHGARVYGRVTVEVKAQFIAPELGSITARVYPVDQPEAASRHYQAYGLTMYEYSYMQGYGADPAKWPKRFGHWMVRDHGQNGWAVQKDEGGEKESLIYDELMAQWNKSMVGRMPKIENVLGKEETAKAEAQVTGLIDQHLASLRAQFAHDFLAAVETSGDLKSQMVAMGGARQTLVAAMELAYPVTMSSTDSVRALFFGADRLPSREMVLNTLQQPGELITSLKSLKEGLPAKLTSLRGQLKELALRRPQGERQPMLTQAYGRLRLLQQATELGQPLISIEEAVARIQAALKEAARG
ncbi:hypothetical protein K2X33_07280 [bacterium]|nr:hypothetical protein [bacterium]